MEDEGSVLKYMTKSEIEAQRSSLLIMTQCLFGRKVKQIEILCNPQSIDSFYRRQRELCDSPKSISVCSVSVLLTDKLPLYSFILTSEVKPLF